MKEMPWKFDDLADPEVLRAASSLIGTEQIRLIEIGMSRSDARLSAADAVGASCFRPAVSGSELLHAISVWAGRMNRGRKATMKNGENAAAVQEELVISRTIPAPWDAQVTITIRPLVERSHKLLTTCREASLRTVLSAMRPKEEAYWIMPDKQIAEKFRGSISGAAIRLGWSNGKVRRYETWMLPLADGKYEVHVAYYGKQ